MLSANVLLFRLGLVKVARQLYMGKQPKNMHLFVPSLSSRTIIKGSLGMSPVPTWADWEGKLHTDCEVETVAFLLLVIVRLWYNIRDIGRVEGHNAAVVKGECLRGYCR